MTVQCSEAIVGVYQMKRPRIGTCSTFNGAGRVTPCGNRKTRDLGCAVFEHEDRHTAVCPQSRLWLRFESFI